VAEMRLGVDVVDRRGDVVAHGGEAICVARDR
jgi:hypothetical protein